MRLPTSAALPRVLIVSLGKTFGGAEVYVENLTSLLEGHAILFCLTAHPELSRRLKGKGVRLLWFPSLPQCLHGLRFLIGTVLVGFAALRHGIQVVQTNGYSEVLALLPARVLGCKAFTTRHLTFDIDGALSLENLARRFARLIYRIGARFANGVICVSGPVAKEARTLIDPGRITVIHNWVPDVPCFIAHASNRPVKILFVGRLVEHKGLRVLLAAAKGLGDLELTIVGEGEGRPQLERFAKGLVTRFVGFQSDPRPFYREADIFVNPSLGPEGMPLVSLEAMGQSVPCILSDLPVHNELAEDGKSALLFRSGDANDLREKLLILMNNGEMRRGYAARAHDMLLRKYTSKVAQERYLCAFGIADGTA